MSHHIHIDRQPELDRFEAMLHGRQEERILLIEAPSGRGKTWLLLEYQKRAGQAGLPCALIDLRVGGVGVSDALATLGEEVQVYRNDKITLDQIAEAKPSLHVCSVREGAWLQLDAVPTRDALQLGHSGPMTSIGFDYRPLAAQPYVPLRADAIFLTSPTAVTRRDDGSYLLTYRHWEESSTELLLRRPLLDQALRNHAGR